VVRVLHQLEHGGGIGGELLHGGIVEPLPAVVCPVGLVPLHAAQVVHHVAAAEDHHAAPPPRPSPRGRSTPTVCRSGAVTPPPRCRPLCPPASLGARLPGSPSAMPARSISCPEAGWRGADHGVSPSRAAALGVAFVAPAAVAQDRRAQPSSSPVTTFGRLL